MPANNLNETHKNEYMTVRYHPINHFRISLICENIYEPFWSVVLFFYLVRFSFTPFSFDRIKNWLYYVICGIVMIEGIKTVSIVWCAKDKTKNDWTQGNFVAMIYENHKLIEHKVEVEGGKKWKKKKKIELCMCKFVKRNRFSAVAACQLACVTRNEIPR